MRSIRTKMLLFFCGSVFGIFILLSSISIYYLKETVEQNNDRTMSLLVNQKVRELNVYFEGIERAVTLLNDSIKAQIDLGRIQEDDTYLQDFLEQMSKKGLEAAAVSGNVYALYFRMIPERFGDDAGFFITDNGYGDYMTETLTVVGDYDQTDREHVAWYYEPIENGQAMWLEPYMNKNIDVYMTSYVIPVFLNGDLIGVVGMDLDMSLIQDVVDSVDYLEGTGYLLCGHGDIIYSPKYPEGLKTAQYDAELDAVRRDLLPEWNKDDGLGTYYWHGNGKCFIAQGLKSGLILGIAVSDEMVEKPLREMEHQMMVLIAVVCILVGIVIWRVLVGIIKPLRELTIAASRIAKGEMNVKIGYHSANEIGKLSDSIRIMEDELKEYFLYMHSQAYTDAMTGVGNKTSYLDLVRKLDRKIQEEMADFAVAVFDLNGLKSINDRYGHEVGDLFITDAASVIKKVFGAENTYRIGGDEFIVVLENMTRDEMEKAFKQIDEGLREVNQEERHQEESLAISKGASFFEMEKDKTYKEVFKRADELMYRDKAVYYKGKHDRKRR